MKKGPLQAVQRRIMFFRIFEIIIFRFVVAIFNQVLDVEAVYGLF